MPLLTPTLQTARLCVRPFTEADADPLFEMHSSAYVLRYWDAPPWTERARADRFLAFSRQLADEGTGVRLAIDLLSDNGFIGWCCLAHWNPDHRSASLGYCLQAAAWGHGYATEAADALLRWAFDTLDLNRVQAEVDTRNPASARVLEKIGFVREGTLRENCVVNGEVSDSWVFGLIRRDLTPPQPVDGADGPRVQSVRIVHLTAPVFRALADGDLTAANAASPVPLSPYFAGDEWRDVWLRRSSQVEHDAASAAWVTGVIWDERQQLAVGRAGYHGPPDAAGMVEIGYAVDPAYRRRGYARAALEALLERAAREPHVHTVRVSIAPDNVASHQLAAQYGFTKVGEQWDDEDGLEIVYEVPARQR